MGSDWTWDLQVRTVHPVNTVIHEVLMVAVGFGLELRRPDGHIVLLVNDGELRVVDDRTEAISALATGAADSKLWTADAVDLYFSCRPDDAGTSINLTWSLDAAWTFRSPGSHAEGYRRLHARLTALWLEVAEALNARVGRVVDEWSLEQIWHLPRIHEEDFPAGAWPALLGWWTYLGTEVSQTLPSPPLPEISAATRRLPSGARLVALLEDPAAVDESRYQAMHVRWLQGLATS